jgi:hypothetical protein
MDKLKVSNELVNLIKLTIPEYADSITLDTPINSLAEITKSWRIGDSKRLAAGFEDKYSAYRKEIHDTYTSLGLNKTKLPSYNEYQAVVIFGGTGLSNCIIWKNLISYYQDYGIRFSEIYLLAGDRLFHPHYDDLKLAYKYYPNMFTKQVNVKEVSSYNNEMQIMEFIHSILKLPVGLHSIPVTSVYAQGKVNKEGIMIQADSADTIAKLIEEHEIPKNLPILFLSTIPYIVRQGVQAEMMMTNYQIDIAANSEPYLETIDTPLKGELPTALYMDELYWFIYFSAKRVIQSNC